MSSFNSLFTSSVPRPAIVSSSNEREYKHSDKEIKDLINPSNFNTLNLRPEYQRHIRWRPDAMNKFIDSVMKKRYIMPILMYRLHPSDLTGKYKENTPYKYEVMDGQHRLYTLNAFRSAERQSLPSVTKEFIVHWVLEQKDENGKKMIVHIFYKKTPDVEDWCNENDIINPEYLTDEGRDLFDETVIKVTTIVSRLSMNERRAEFLSLQNGIPVRGSDLLKNEVGCKLMVAYNNYDYEEMMTDIFLKRCTKKADKYTVNWMARCYLIFKSVDNPSEAFLIGDKVISSRIKSSHSSLHPSDDEFADFHDAFLDFKEFLSNLDASITFNPTQIFALFYGLCENRNNHEIIHSYMPYFSKDGQQRYFKRLWESDPEESRRGYFDACLEQIRDMTTMASPYDDRQVTKSLRKRVWEKCENGKCLICQESIDKDNFEAGHIVARAKGGQTELENLIPICFNCNRSMGTRNAYEYKESRYPYN